MKTAQITGSKAAERGWPKKRSCVLLSGGWFISVNSRARLLVRDEAPSNWENRSFAARLSVAADNGYMALPPNGLVRKICKDL